MTTLDNGIVIDESSWNSQNYTPAAQVPAVYGIPRKISAVTVHHWGDPAWGQKFNTVADYLSRAGGDTSAHFVVEAGRVACLISPDDAAWHAGSATGNATSIGIEMHPRASEEDMQTLASLIRWLESIYGSLMIYRHSDWFGTACPGAYADKIGHIVDLVNAGKPTSGTKNVPASAKTITLTPVTGYQVLQNFGDGKDLSSNTGVGHSGMDFATPVGTPAIALEAGTVLWADWAQNLPGTSWTDRWFIGSRGFAGLPIDAGICIIIQHGTWISTYSHMNKTDLNPGDKVVQGQVVGETGYTGYTYNSVTGFAYEEPRGAHLHFEALVDTTNYYTTNDGSMIYGRVDPRPYFIQTVEASNQLASATVLRAELEKEKKELSILTEKFKNFKTGGQTDAATELGWLPQNFQTVFESISNIRKELLNQKILKQGATQKQGDMTSLALEVAYMADNFARTHQALARIEARLDKIEGK